GASTCGAADRLRAGTPAPGAPAGGLSRQRFPDHLVTGEPTMNRMSRRFLLALAFAAGAAAAQAQTLRIGLAEDPDALDPSLARTFVGRLVFAGLCDKLFDIDEKLAIVPQLATGYEWSGDGKALTLKLRP